MPRPQISRKDRKELDKRLNILDRCMTDMICLGVPLARAWETILKFMADAPKLDSKS